MEKISNTITYYTFLYYVEKKFRATTNSNQHSVVLQKYGFYKNAFFTYLLMYRDGSGQFFCPRVGFRVFGYFLRSPSGQARVKIFLAKIRNISQTKIYFGLLGFSKIYHGLAGVLEKIARVRSDWPKRPRAGFDPTHYVQLHILEI